MTTRLSRMARTNRGVETFAFVLGVLNLSLHAVVESLRHWGFTHGKDCPADHGFPYAVLMISALLVAPKMIGRARAGRAWEALTLRLTGRGPAQATVTMQPPARPSGEADPVADGDEYPTRTADGDTPERGTPDGREDGAR
ncbi:MAG TPA: hypothetical protein VEB59_08215 [Gemmatimonadales bacterium]|nr:hypothetical protein [Gemmatimonadales bacterium]